MMKEFDTNDYIILRNIDYGSSFAVDLIYHFEKEELFALKRPNTNDCGIKKLVEREIGNYTKLNHPFIPKYYGKVKNNNSFIFEFINGLGTFI